MKLSITALGLAGLALLAAGTAQAHRTWLLPQTAHINAAAGAKPTLVSIDAVASEELFEYEIGLQLGQVLVLGPDGKALTPEPAVTARNRTSFDVKLEQVGTYRISNNAESVFASYKLGGDTKRWRGKPSEMAAQIPAEAQELQVTRTWMLSETFVSKERAGLPPAQPGSEGLALQALTPVTDLSNGDAVHLRLLLDGKPLPDATVTVLRGGSRYRYKLGELTLKTDAQGELKITWAEPGRYWLGLGHESAATAEQPAKRYRYSATFEVLPK
ncbi:DUF4198 domain-containing protein [Roseateles oligotrophus]|uniref:DUF4198 domain-containing protein n=1 Tax=Roseateles oligotrophus TaxID=1769250 RepID=A0ABT2YGJ3_9BURK|nr:DUF4198 domain-containing protein [Roseateles oligotrophus]MCV2369170.1 DUF4198 domain-containing protein [Roseateles oligotrophus]